jgi:hypothetical protein
MIVVKITALGGVRDVVFDSRSEEHEDAQLAVWSIVREELARLDRRLRREAPAILARTRGRGQAA